MSIKLENLANIPEIQHADAIVMPGYSSNETGPSNLSRFAYHAAVSVREKIGNQEGRVPILVLATERSLPDGETTGQLLIDQEHAPIDGETAVLPDYFGNRLLNTNYQVEGVAEWLREASGHAPLLSFHMVAYGFHRVRLQRAMQRQGIRATQFIPVESIMAQSYPADSLAAQNQFKKTFGMELTWPEIVAGPLQDFYRREKHTQFLDKITRGHLMNVLSRVSHRGRYDDILPDGTAIHKEPTVTLRSLLNPLSR